MAKSRETVVGKSVPLQWSKLVFACWNLFNLLQLSIAFHIETSFLIHTTNHITGCYMKYNTGLSS